MAIQVVDDMLAYMAANTGACTLELREVVGSAAHEALRRAESAVIEIEHPEEASEPLPSYVSVTEIDGGAAITLDIADAESYDGLLERVLREIVLAIEAAGVTGGLLTHP